MNWFHVQKLIELEGFENFAQNMEKDAPNRFKEWFNELAPEEVGSYIRSALFGLYALKSL